MDIHARRQAFIELGKRIRQYGNTGRHAGNDAISRAVEQSLRNNPWFTEASINTMLGSIASSLMPDQLEQWIDRYSFPDLEGIKTVAVVMAGNIPAVGFHDFLCVLVSGHAILAKLSSDDSYLIPALAGMLMDIEPAFRDRIGFTEDKLSGFEAVIATGSNNTSRYFSYYFGRYPNIIRKNRNGVGVVTGGETQDQLELFGDDIFTYYGLGCRNISKLFVPDDYDLSRLFDAIRKFEWAGDHHKYRNNYDYNKSIFLVNGEPHFDNGFLLMKEDAAIASPVSVLNYERYTRIEDVIVVLEQQASDIQCVVSIDKKIPDAVLPGASQHPKLWDYADGLDTISFLLEL